MNKPEQQLGQLRAELAYTSSQQIIERGLHEFVDDLQRRLNAIGEGISDTFFAMRTIEVASQRQASFGQSQIQLATAAS